MTDSPAGGPVGVDVHGHGVPREFVEEVRTTRLAGVDVESADGGGYVLTFPGGKPLRPMSGATLDFSARLDWMDSEGLRCQVVAPWLDVDGQVLDAAAGRDWVRLLNDHLAAAAGASAGRLRAYATVHLADPAAAAAALARAVTDLGMRGCMIPTSVASGSLSDPAFDPLWEAAQDLGAPVVLHPPTIAPSGSLFARRPVLKGILGRLIDTTVCAADMIIGGVFDRYPGLTIVLVHGGGFLPYQTGRFDREFAGGSSALALGVPSEYVKRFYYDTVLMSPAALSLLLDVAGSGQVMLGSDYGAGARYRNTARLADSLTALRPDEATYRQVTYETAEGLLRDHSG